MIYKRRNLQRLFEVKVYTGDRNAKKPKTTKMTCIAWNDVDVARKIGDRIAEPPTPLHYVVMEADGQFHKIIDTSGPTDEVVEADIE